MAKYILNPLINASILNDFGLPIEPIVQFGVIYLDTENNTLLGEDGLEHTEMMVSFIYKNDEGENLKKSIDKKTFDSIFEYAGE